MNRRTFLKRLSRIVLGLPFINNLTLIGPDPVQPVKVELISLSYLPDVFDEAIDIYAKTIALTFGIDVREF